MSKLQGNILYGQSGGPTSVINSSAYGVIMEARKHKEIGQVIVMKHGIKGALNEEFFFIDKQDEETIELLKHTPGSAFGSVRFKLKDFREDDSNYLRLLYIFKKYNIRYFLYNGGNDSMDTCAKIADYMSHIDYDCRIIGIPKTIDNDLPCTDHTPGYGSAAKFISNTMMEICYDMLAYPNGKVTIVEIMGRHAGWLTGAAGIANLSGFGPDLIYFPEVPFSVEKFKEDVKRVYHEKKQCLVAVSEGITNEEGIFISSSSGMKDAFGHFQLGGVASKLATSVASDLGIPSRSVEFGSTQRAAAHLQSLTDVNEAIAVGRHAVEAAVKGESDLMVAIDRLNNDPYEIGFSLHSLVKCANTEKRVPRTMINEQGNGITQEFLDYVLPLIQGENPPKFKGGIQQFSKLKD
ncbi:MAG: 6-phosphofructokinase [Candidatus Izemoplasmatales bacterium]|nr:6-phosphofructokinase [Candidatus Izemoplasmatales bacterium]